MKAVLTARISLRSVSRIGVRLSVAIVGILFGGGTVASATTLDFDGVPGGNGSSFVTYTESGFTVESTAGSWVVSITDGNPSAFIQFTRVAGEETITAGLRVTRGGVAFRFSAVDLYSSATPIPYVFRGLVNSTAVFTVTGTVPNTGSFASVVNPNSADLIDTLEITLSNPITSCCGNSVGLDNIVATAVPVTRAGTERISLAPDGGQRALASARPAMSAAARFVAFEALVDQVLDVREVYVHDRQTGVTEQVSLFGDGIARSSDRPAISADGRFVAFRAASVCPDCVGGRSAADVFVRDRLAGTTERASVFADGRPRASDAPGISADGRFVAFAAFPDSCTSPCSGLFLRDRQTQSTQQIRSPQSPVGRPSISDDGRFIAVASVPPIICRCDTSVSVYDRQADTWDGVGVGTGPSISADGRFVVMTLLSAQFFEGPDVILYDRITKTVTSVSHGVPPGRVGGASGVMSRDGRFVAWVKAPEGVVVTDRVLDRETVLGIPCASGATSPLDGDCPRELAISEEGRRIAFSSTAPDLVPDDTNGVGDVFVHSSEITAFIAGLYGEALGRTADPGGLTEWVDVLAAACTPAGLTGVSVEFFDSAEFRTTRPLTIEGLVSALYRGLLGRDPEPEGQSFWTTLIRQQRIAVAVDAFAGSEEFRNLVPDRHDAAAVAAVIARFYTEILGRPPDPAGFAGWVEYVRITASVEFAAAAFLSSGEFERRGLTSQQFIAILYRGILGRDPEPAGLDAWDRVIRSQLVDLIDAGFMASEEFGGRVPVLCGT